MTGAFPFGIRNQEYRICVLALTLSSATAMAQMQGAGADCDCRARGVKWAQGAEICLGDTMHRCGMSLNVSSWLDTQRPCPQASLGTQFKVVRLKSYAEAAFSSLSE